MIPVVSGQRDTWRQRVESGDWEVITAELDAYGGALPYRSTAKGQWGGHRRARIYGRLDCPAALRAIARGRYARYRVFFADESTAIAAGYRPCGVCCADRYREWKGARCG